MITYSNKYGTAVLELVTPYAHVSTYRYADVPIDCLYPIDTLEELVAVSENRRMQISLGFPIQPTGYVMHHSEPSQAAICRIVDLEFKARESARAILAKPQAVIL